MVAVGEGYCRRARLAKILSSALFSVSRVVNCDRRAGVVWMIVVYFRRTERRTFTGAEEYVLAMGVSAWDPQC
jgi:hypothetical protein